MEPSFWAERWREGRIGFHEGAPNALLARHVDRLPPGRVLVPLCGKAEDLAFLASTGREVVGVELVEDAVRAFFAEHDLTPQVTGHGPEVTRYVAGPITVFAGDLFAVSRALAEATCGLADAVYDRAALVALPPELRPRYLAHLRALTRDAAGGAPGLLVAFEHDRGDGPPFSVPADMVNALYRAATPLERVTDPAALQGRGLAEVIYAVTL